MRSADIVTWADLAGIAGHFQGGSWIFRGQPVDKALVPKIGRPDSRRDPVTNLPIAYNRDHERQIFRQFVRRARPFVKGEAMTDLELLALAQHYGMPTRLLDWTENLMVAAYFATETAGSDGQPVIFAIKRNLRELHGDEDPLSIRAPAIYRPAHVTARITAQAGLFTVHPAPTQPFAPPSYYKLKIARQYSYRLKKSLNAIGINAASIRPDLEGLAQYLAWVYKRPTSVPGLLTSRKT